MIELSKFKQSFDSFKRPDLPSITLCKASSEPIFAIERLIYNTSLELKFNEISLFSFTIPKIAVYKDEILNAYDEVKTKKLIHINGIGYFIISKVSEKEDGSSPILEVECESIESELLYKRFFLKNEKTPIGLYNMYSNGYDSSGNPSNLYFTDDRITKFVDELGVKESYFRTVLERVFEQCPDWNVGYIDKDVVWKPNDDGTYPVGPIPDFPVNASVYIPREDGYTISLLHFENEKDENNNDIVEDFVYDDIFTVANQAGVIRKDAINGWLKHGNAQIAKNDYHFGNGSLRIDGNPDSYIYSNRTDMWQLDSMSNPKTCVWTVDFWLKIDEGNNTEDGVIIKSWNTNAPDYYWSVTLDKGSKIKFNLTNYITMPGGNIKKQSFSVSKSIVSDAGTVNQPHNWDMGVFNHVAIVKREDNKIQISFNGQEPTVSRYADFNFPTGCNKCIIGSGFVGYIDEVRFSKTNRWKNLFTPRSYPYRAKPIEQDKKNYNLYTNRTFDIDDSTIYDFLINDVQKSFNCFITFDIENKLINAYSVNNESYIRRPTDLFLSYDNLIKSSEFTELTDEIATSLYCYGGGGLSIYEINPLGSKVIYDFSYFKTKDWMTDHLISGINKWEEKIQLENDEHPTEYYNPMQYDPWWTYKDPFNPDPADLMPIPKTGKGLLEYYYRKLRQVSNEVPKDEVIALYIIAWSERNREINKYKTQIDQIETDLKTSIQEEFQSMADIVEAKKKKKGKKTVNPLDPKNLSDYKKCMNFLMYGGTETLLPTTTHPNPEYRLKIKKNNMKEEDVYEWATYGSLYSNTEKYPLFIGIEDKCWALSKKYYYQIEKTNQIKYSDRAEFIIDKLEGDLNLKPWNGGDNNTVVPSYYSEWKAAYAERVAEIKAEYEKLYATHANSKEDLDIKKSKYYKNIQWLRYGTITTGSGKAVKSVVPPLFVGASKANYQLSKDNLYGFDVFGPLSNILRAIAVVDYSVEQVRNSMAYINKQLSYTNILEKDSIQEYIDRKNIDMGVTGTENAEVFTPNFTEEELKELSHFIIENSYTNENITINNLSTTKQRLEQAKKLYSQSRDTLSRIKEPRFEFSISVANFLALQNFAYSTDALYLGSEVTIKTNKGIITAVLLEIKLSYDDISSFELVFSNKIRRVGKEFLYSEIMGQLIKSTTNINSTNKKLNDYNNTLYQLNQSVNSNFDLTKNSIVSTNSLSDPNIEISQNGIRLTEQDTDGLYTGFSMVIHPGGIYYTDNNFVDTKVLVGSVFENAEDSRSTTTTGTTTSNNTNLLLISDNYEGLIENNDGQLVAAMSFGIIDDVVEDTEVKNNEPTLLGYGLNANALLGNIRTGKNLQLKSDNGFSKLTANDEGVFIENAFLKINNDGSGLLMDPKKGFKIGTFVGDDIISPNFYADTIGNLTLKATIFADNGTIGGWKIRREGMFSPDEDSSFMKYKGEFDETIFKIKDVLTINNNNTGIFKGNVLADKIQGIIPLNKISLDNKNSDIEFKSEKSFIIHADGGLNIKNDIYVNNKKGITGEYIIGTTTLKFEGGILVEVIE